MLIMLQRVKAQSYGHYIKTTRSFIHQHLLTNHPPQDIYPEHLSGINLRATTNVMNSKQQTIALRKVRKVSNKSNTRSQKLLCSPCQQRCIPQTHVSVTQAGHQKGRTQPSSKRLPLGVTQNYLAKVIKHNREQARTLKNNLKQII